MCLFMACDAQRINFDAEVIRRAGALELRHSLRVHAALDGNMAKHEKSVSGNNALREFTRPADCAYNCNQSEI
jgi:hypothetical protein